MALPRPGREYFRPSHHWRWIMNIGKSEPAQMKRAAASAIAEAVRLASRSSRTTFPRSRARTRRIRRKSCSVSIVRSSRRKSVPYATTCSRSHRCGRSNPRIRRNRSRTPRSLRLRRHVEGLALGGTVCNTRAVRRAVSPIRSSCRSKSNPHPLIDQSCDPLAHARGFCLFGMPDRC